VGDQNPHRREREEGLMADNPPARDAPINERLEWLNEITRADQTDQPITGVVVDGSEDTSAIVLLRDGARSIVIPGSAALLNPQRLQAICGAVLRIAMPNLKRDTTKDIADIVWSLANVRSIYDSVDSATDWGRSYLYLATASPPIQNGHSRWTTFQSLKADEQAAETQDRPPPATVVPWTGDARLVIRPWFHRHVQVDLGHHALSEQRIATLMGLAGWESLPTSRSAITARNPDDRSQSVQFRFYVVPTGWEPSLDETEDDQ
jgi:hypothetical protein